VGPSELLPQRRQDVGVGLGVNFALQDLRGPSNSEVRDLVPQHFLRPDDFLLDLCLRRGNDALRLGLGLRLGRVDGLGLELLALMDDLTRLYNRRAFHALSTQQFKVMRRKGQGLLLFFADVDHLKNINDTYGHREGDLALVRAADALERTFRDSDILARLGGDEFAVLALEASCEDQDAILRRLEGHLQKLSAEEPRYKLSLSVGAARFDPKDSVSLGDLLAKADRAMYEQKNTRSKPWMSRP